LLFPSHPSLYIIAKYESALYKFVELKDPVARRKMWGAIAEAAPGRSIVLTTHSMEECEALCSRVGIMVGGKFKCLGPVPHLKTKFSQGLNIEIRCRPDDDMSNEIEGSCVPSSLPSPATGMATNIARAVSFLKLTFPGTTVHETHGNFLKLDVPSTMAVQKGAQTPSVGMLMGAAFRVIEDNREELNIEDYSVSQVKIMYRSYESIL